MIHAIREWSVLACAPSVILRGLKFAVVVGAILVAINHGDAILAGDVDAQRMVKMGLTIVVPYAVSVLSSVGAMRQRTPPSHAPAAGAR